MKTETQYLTKSEAIEQGYTEASQEDSYNPCMLTDLDDSELGSSKYFLVQKEPVFACIDESYLYDAAMDAAKDSVMAHIEDDDFLTDAINEAVDFKVIAEKINEKLFNQPIYVRSHIRVLP